MARRPGILSAQTIIFVPLLHTLKAGYLTIYDYQLQLAM